MEAHPLATERRGAALLEGMLMLVLSRKIGERIVIRDDIFVTLVEIRGDKVRLGIDAPDDVPVHRLEVWQAIQREAAANDAA